MKEQQQVDYEGQGFLVVEAALSADELESIGALIDEAVSVDALHNLPNQDDAFIHLAEHPILFPIIHGIMSDDVALRSVKGWSIDPGARGRGWHREVASMLGVNHAASNMCTQLFVCLDDCGENDGGGFTVVPASHLLKADLPFPDITHIEDMPNQLPLRLKAGSALILHGNIWQSRMRHEGKSRSRLLEYAYIHCWMRQALPKLSSQARATMMSTSNLASLFGITPERRYWDDKVTGYQTSNGLPARRYSPLSSVGKGTEPNH